MAEPLSRGRLLKSLKSYNSDVGKTVLLLNPNRYRHPPVIPLALECLAHSLEQKGIGTRVLDLCFSEDPAGELASAMGQLRPDALCVTVRNVDTVLYPDTEFFLPDIRKLIKTARGISSCPVIIGGSALRADPAGILEYLGADIAVTGPGERTLPRIVGDANTLGQKRLVIGEEPPTGYGRRRLDALDYARYIEEDGLAGFETHKGCSSRCVYCMEAGTPVFLKDPGAVMGELRDLAEGGFFHLHLCDSEFNEDLEFSLEVLGRMAAERLGIRWALYMKPGTYDGKLFELLARTGAYLVTLSVDTFRRPPEYWKDVRRMSALARENGIRMCIELLSGFPGEDEDALRRGIELVLACGPDDAMVNTYLRLYPGIAVARLIEAEPELKKNVTGDMESALLSPVFYNRVPVERLRELTGGERLLRIAGEGKGVNYQKVDR